VREATPACTAIVFAACAVTVLGITGAAEAAQRTFVSTLGNDANNCALATPCRGLAKAITVTDPGGELVVLDSGGYGLVTVSKNVTILSPAGVYAGISVLAATDGITVAAPATQVVLRGLTINGQGGNNGIRVQAGEVHIESTVISNMAQAGILVEGGTSVRISGTVARSNVDGLRIVPAAGTVAVLVRDSEFSNNASSGIGVSPSAGGAGAQVTVERSSVTKNGVGLTTAPTGSATATLVVTQSVASENGGAGVSSSGAGATVYVRESAITRNGIGLLQASSGALNACGANLLVANGMAQSGTISTSSCLDVPSGSGTVTSVATGAGLTGGPIITTGTISLAATNLLPTVACAANQIPKWSGSAWTCQNDANSGGTVTSVATGTGLTGGPITGTGTINLASTQLLPATACAANEIPKWNGSAWTCGTDNAGPANAFVQGGNAFGVPSKLGATDNQPIELYTNNQRALRLEPGTTSPNVLGGYAGNGVFLNVQGANTSGGGAPGVQNTVIATDYSGTPVQCKNTYGCINGVTDSWGAIGGGLGNQAGNGVNSISDTPFATVGGGAINGAFGAFSTIGGGRENQASGSYSFIGGGLQNHVTNLLATVGGGFANTASATFATVGGGDSNMASSNWSTVSGGQDNVASGAQSTVVGGAGNQASGQISFAAGYKAHADTNSCALFALWSDPFTTGFTCQGVSNLFRVGADHGFDVSYLSPLGGGGSRFVYIGDFYLGDTIHAWNGAHLTDGGTWTNSSDRDKKENFVVIDTRDILARVAALPVTQWNYKAEPGVRRIGPVAQDFHAAFGLGADDKGISTVDEGGVALAAIQGLYAELNERNAMIAEQQSEIVELRARMEQVESLRGELATLRKMIAAATTATQTDMISARLR